MEIGFQFVPPSTDDSHPATLVNIPLRDNEPLLFPVQTDVLELIVPDEGASTVIMPGVEKAETLGGDGASSTSARYQVVVFRFA